MSNDPFNKDRKYDLGERTACFGEAVITFAKRISVNEVSKSLIIQLVRACTSVGANYDETDEAESRKDFRHKIARCRKESRESRRWFRMIVAAQPEMNEAAKPLAQEAKELHLIFCAIIRKLDH